MERRKFLASTLAASALASARLAANESEDEKGGREFYQLRHYVLPRGPQEKQADDYFGGALIPALNRMGVKPVGVLNVAIGPDTPGVYVLLPSMSLETLVMVEDRLAQDSEYAKAGMAFLNAPGREPAYEVMEISLMRAFERMPKHAIPAATVARAPRIFELRTYQSRGQQDHNRKVGMFNGGEIDIQLKWGFSPVFYADTLIGPRLPNLNYLLCFENTEDRDKKFAGFVSSPEWKAMSTDPKYPLELVSNINNIILRPAAYSQI